MLHYALAALHRGWPPIPLAPHSKAPLLGRGYQHLHPVEADVRGWWRRWPTANVGLLLEPAGLLIVDLDSRAAVAEAERLGCPGTYTVLRGAEHMHLYYRRPTDVSPGRTTHRGESHAIDILGRGLVVGAGSRHASGDTYTVVRVLPLPLAPAWACDLLRGCPETARADTAAATVQAGPEALRRLRSALRPDVRAVLDHGAPDGARSEALWRVAKEAVRAGLSDTEIIAGCLAADWIVSMRPRMVDWLAADLTRARAAVAGEAPHRGRRPLAAADPWAWAPTAPTRANW